MNPEAGRPENWEQRTARTKREIDDRQTTEQAAKTRLDAFERTSEEIEGKKHNEEAALERIEALDVDTWDPSETIVRDQLEGDYDDAIDELMAIKSDDIPEQILSARDLATYKAYLKPQMKADVIKLTLKALKESGKNLDDLKPEEIGAELKNNIFAQSN